MTYVKIYERLRPNVIFLQGEGPSVDKPFLNN